MRQPRCSLLVWLYGLTVLLVAVNSYGAKSAPTAVIDEAAVRVAEYSFPDERSIANAPLSEKAVSPGRPAGSAYGFGYLLSTTYWDMQHYGSMGRQVTWGSDPACLWTLHTNWTKRPGPMATNEIEYNAWDGSGGFELGLYSDFQSRARFSVFRIWPKSPTTHPVSALIKKMS